MKANIIEELFYGNILPQESKSNVTAKLKDKLRKMSETEDKLRGVLSDETLQLFEEYVDKSNEFSCISSANSYVTGFRHGSRFTYDAFIDE